MNFERPLCKNLTFSGQILDREEEVIHHDICLTVNAAQYSLDAYVAQVFELAREAIAPAKNA